MQFYLKQMFQTLYFLVITINNVITVRICTGCSGICTSAGSHIRACTGCSGTGCLLCFIKLSEKLLGAFH